MNIDTKIFNLPTKFNNTLKRSYTNLKDQVGFILRMQDWFNIHKSINVIQQVNRIKEKSHTMISVHTGRPLTKSYIC
jgi:regulation of enolase protein 1 (concanavalin A-like superfamily)